MIELAANERAVHGDFFNSKCLLLTGLSTLPDNPGDSTF